MEPLTNTNYDEITVDERTANYFSAVVFFAALLLFGIPYGLLWQFSSLINAFRSFLSDYLTLFVSVIAGMALHEALHGFTWASYCRDGMRSVEFGIKWRALAPYAQCNERIPIRGYRLGGIMPAIVLGVVPAVAAIITGNGWLLVFGIFFTAGAAGDFMVLWKLRHYNSGYQVLDHPEKIGCLLTKK